MRLCLTLFFGVLSFCFSNAQTCGAIAYDSDDGLAATNYMGVFQDSHGILWVGSYGSGVSRFDGKHWECWTTANGMLSKTVSHIFEDREGALWFDHNDQGASRFKDGKWQKFGFHPDSSVVGQLLFDPKRKTVFIIENGWHGKVATRIFEYDYNKKKFGNSEKTVLPENLSPAFSSFDFFPGKAENEWWVQAVNNKKKSIAYYHVQDQLALKLPAPPGSFEQYPRLVCSNAALEIDAGEAIAQNETGMYILKNGHWRKLPAPPVPPTLQFNASFYDPGSQTLFAVWQLREQLPEKRYLLAEYNATNLQLRKTLLFSHSFVDGFACRQIIKDLAGTIWLGTTSKVLRLFPDKLYIPVTAPGMPSEPWGIAQSGDGTIWFASNDAGLAGFDGLYLRPPTAKSMPNKIFSDGSLTDDQGNVYFNSVTPPDYGILKFDGKNQWEVLAKGEVGFFLARNKKNQVMWGTSGQGLWILPTGKSGKAAADWTKIDHKKGLQLTNVLTALQDQYGRYWMGRTSQGVALYDAPSGRVTNWLRSQDPKNYGVASIAEDSRGNLWFGTDRGLYFFENHPDLGADFDLPDHLERVGMEETGESTVMSCMAYNAQTLVFGNSKGLFLLDLDAYYGNPRQILLRPFNLKNGYQAGPVGQNSLMVDRDSFIWLTAANGALRFDPRALPRDTAIPQLYLDKLMAGRDTHTDFSYCLELSSEQRYVEIFFHAPLNPMLYDNVQFEYRLTGDSIWQKISSGAESVAFTSLNAGMYRFEIRAKKEGLVSVVSSVDFQISPVLWERPLFWLFVLAAVLGIGAIWWRREVKIAGQNLQIANQQLQIEKNINNVARLSMEKDKLQVQAIVNQLNPHFINNALQWLQVRVDEDDEAVRLIGKLSENISVVFKNSRMKRAYHSMQEEMKLTENFLFIQKCRFGNKLTYEMPNKETLAKLESIPVPLMIVQIHAENGVEHGIRNKSTGIGRVRISLVDDDDYVVIYIEDDGIGRAAAQEIGSLGTQNGTKMLQELQEIYNKQNKLPLVQFYEDAIFIDEDGNAFGTRAVIRMPKEYNFEIKQKNHE